MITMGLVVSYVEYPKNELGNFDENQKRFTGRYSWAFLDNYMLMRKHE